MSHIPAFSLVGILCSGTLWGGCTFNLGFPNDAATKLEVEAAIAEYHAAAIKVKIGDPKEKALNILLPTQDGLHQSLKRPRDSYMKERDLVEVYYFRTSRRSDRAVTLDEFTPYVFKRGTLVFIGWPALGDQKTGILEWGHDQLGVGFSDIGFGGR